MNQIAPMIASMDKTTPDVLHNASSENKEEHDVGRTND